ncbi:MAG: DUF4344 domain-containing metallopeptidase [Pseudomonadota bacterium]
MLRHGFCIAICLLSVFVCGSSSATGTAPFEVIYRTPDGDDQRAVLDALNDARVIDIAQKRFAERVDLSDPIRIVFGTRPLRRGGPHYDPERRTIQLPYDFWVYVWDEINHAEPDLSVEEIDILATDVVIHTLYHEIAHALIDVLDLPITGQEETVADEFATLMIIADFDDGLDIVRTAAEFFELEGSYVRRVTDADLFREHALDDQRFFHVICLLHGHDAQSVDDILAGLDVTSSRLALCSEDYRRRVAAWDVLLNLHRE